MQEMFPSVEFQHALLNAFIQWSMLGDSPGLTVLIAVCSTLNKIWKQKEMQIFSYLLFNLKTWLCKTVKYRMQVWAPHDRDHFWKVFMVSISFYFAYE